MQIKKILANLAVPLALVLARASVSHATVTITGNQGACTSRAGSGHATTTLFFGKDIRNVIATNNEFQTVGEFVGSVTNLTFDIWESQGSRPGACIGSINVSIDAGTNESAQFAVEDHLITPGGGQGVIVRTGSFDNRMKFDIYLDVTKKRKRQIIWNNFVGLPNPSELMSAMRFVSGQHLAIAYTGPIGSETEADIQVFDNAGNFVAVAFETIGANSVVITNATRSLKYFDDVDGNRVRESALPRDGEGYIKVRLNNEEASFVILYKRAKPNSTMKKRWNNTDLTKSTITFARRNGGNDRRGIGE